MEQGKVIKVNDNKATVALSKTDACKSCGACNAFGGADKLMTCEVENTLGVAEGDRVYIEIAQKHEVIATFLIFVMPVLFMIIGYFVGFLISSVIYKSPSEKVGVGVAAIFFAFSLYVVKVIDEWAEKNKKFVPVLLRKL
ncbi:MAG: hypothetical protein C4562_01700 [Actinobacteria bacterium]|nr:MAG: hypothetical protein C4562_01700 [Actinomycetota bacterium]